MQPDPTVGVSTPVGTTTQSLPTEISAPLLAPPPLIPGYTLLDELGRGGMGVVYRAQHNDLGRIVALKMILHPSHAGTVGLQRFATEARTYAQLRHPHIVAIHECGSHDGLPYFALELVAGGSLAQRLRAGALAPTVAAEWVRQVALAVAYAHQHGIVHRDLKPANVLLTTDPEPLAKVTDFGLAKQIDTAAGLTNSGAVMGTPAYMAPEQAAGQTHLIGPAADVYALGVILYECLTGQTPFQADSLIELLSKVASDAPPSLRQHRHDLPRDLEIICLKCLEKDPARRYASATALADDLHRWQTQQPIRARAVSRGERLWLWVQRHPAWAAVWALALVGVGLTMGGVIVTWLWQRAEVARQLAEFAQQAAERAQQGEAAAHQELARVMYFHTVDLAWREWQSGNTRRTRELLGACSPELRQWEWRVVDRLSKSGRPIGQPSMPGVLTWLEPTVIADWASGRVRRWSVRTGEPLPDQPWPEAKSIYWDPTHQWALCGQARRWWLQSADPQTPVRSVPGEWKQVTGAAVAPDGRHLAINSGANRLTLLDRETGNQQALPNQPSGGTNNLAFSPTGTLLAINLPTEVILWDYTAQQIVGKIDGRDRLDDLVLDLLFSPDGQWLAIFPYAGPVRLWHVPTRRAGPTLVGHEGRTIALAFSAAGDLLATGSTDQTVRVWALPTGQPLTTLRGLSSTVLQVAFSPDGRQVLGAAGDEPARVWQWADETPARTLILPTRVGLSLAVSPDNAQFALGGLGRVVVYDANTLTVEQTLTGPAAWGDTSFEALAFSPDGRWLAGVSADIVVWERRTGAIAQVIALTGKPMSATFSANSQQLWTTWQQTESTDPWVDRAKVYGCTWATNQPLATAVSEPVEMLRAGGVRADGTQAVFLEYDGPARSYRNGQWSAPWPLKLTLNHQLAFSPDGARLVIAGRDGVVIVAADTGAIQHRLVGHEGAVDAARFSPDGQRVATVGKDRTVRIWDAQSGHLVLVFAGYTDRVQQVCFSPNGEQLYTVAALPPQRGQYILKVWSAASKK